MVGNFCLMHLVVQMHDVRPAVFLTRTLSANFQTSVLASYASSVRLLSCNIADRNANHIDASVVDVFNQDDICQPTGQGPSPFSGGLKFWDSWC
eukprot:m.789822 g.789822  ORF g.789822 m.789822 type:complete len:94 (+) comp23325_c0_seq5:330-611(+)